MLTYLQVHLYLVAPPILALFFVYRPLLGQRDVFKIFWLSLVATLYTTPWDNFIIASGGWTYPPNSILGTLWHVPIEEHLFFIAQPIFLILLHSIFSLGQLFPFAPPPILKSLQWIDKKKNEVQTKWPPIVVRTLSRRPGLAACWFGLAGFGVMLVLEAHQVPHHLGDGLGLGQRGFYLGWMLVWAAPVIGMLHYLGAGINTSADRWTLAVGVPWLWLVDTVAIQNGAWSISPNFSLGWVVWKGLPVEEFIFFYLSSHLVVITVSLIAHIHFLLVLHPDLPPCPPSNVFAHASLLARVAFNPPDIDGRLLLGLTLANNNLKKKSRSFDLAKRAFPPEMRIVLLAIYAWCRLTDDLIDEPAPSTWLKSHGSDRSTVTWSKARRYTLGQIRKHLLQTYDPSCSSIDRTMTANSFLQLVPTSLGPFYAFSALVPRLVPIHPFLELCKGYEMDLAFAPVISEGRSPLADALLNDNNEENRHLPIKTQDDLVRYADAVAGSVASAICYAAWSLLEPCPESPTRPVAALAWTDQTHAGTPLTPSSPLNSLVRAHTVARAREMGRALQLVNISRDVVKDAMSGRLYLPLTFFSSATQLAYLVSPPHTPPRNIILNMVDAAYLARDRAAHAIAGLPRVAQPGVRAMVASYFEIGATIRRQRGLVDARGVRVSRSRRAIAAAQAMWFQ